MGQKKIQTTSFEDNLMNHYTLVCFLHILSVKLHNLRFSRFKCLREENHTFTGTMLPQGIHGGQGWVISWPGGSLCKQLGESSCLEYWERVRASCLTQVLPHRYSCPGLNLIRSVLFMSQILAYNQSI